MKDRIHFCGVRKIDGGVVETYTLGHFTTDGFFCPAKPLVEFEIKRTCRKGDETRLFASSFRRFAADAKES
ncbi:MAG: hypothetical protein LBL04_02100 [Bacteroidales bacterium]|jgi:hypothetical protein|nr:hypothetical protein [Bacteroidales bacterium]